MWPVLVLLITKGQHYILHGFSIVYKEDTKIVPSPNILVHHCLAGHPWQGHHCTCHHHQLGYMDKMVFRECGVVSTEQLLKKSSLSC
jgi:hypothetical protein